MKNIELEAKYLNKFYYFMKFIEDEMMFKFKIENKIEIDWIDKYSSELSDFEANIKRVISSLFNKNIEQIYPSLIDSDIFFELDDAFINIDLKVIEADNISDSFEPKREYTPALPTFYNQGKDSEKICLAYFITILYEKENILNINISSISNRIKVIYFDKNMKQEFKDKLKFFEKIRSSNICI